MAKARVLVIGCSDSSSRSGLDADQKVLAEYGCHVMTATTASIIRDAENAIDIIETAPAALRQQIKDSIDSSGVDVVKIGALFSAESVVIVSDALQSCEKALSVVDTEAIFKTGRTTPTEVVKAVREKLLPLTTVLSATVPEAKLLLDDAGIAVDYPKTMEDVKGMAKSVQTLGPKYVLIKREIFQEEVKKTTLHFVLHGQGDPLVVASQFENPKSVTGASYSLPPAIAANLGRGQGVPQALGAAFKFVEDAIKGGAFFD